jgi:ubiquinone/menaquinone biosynthesis C-methylase UbiE
MGVLVKQYELALMLDMLEPQPGDKILDAGCGSGLFTECVVQCGAEVIGLDVSEPMLNAARDLLPVTAFMPIVGDMCALPFENGCFDKTVSITALEFIADAQPAFDELFRITRTDGLVVVATLNSLSPWAARRKSAASENQDSVFNRAYFRSPDELRGLAPVAGKIRTAIHFEKDMNIDEARLVELEGTRRGCESGAFVIGCWQKI